jgi:hypothetical protein
MKVLIYGVWHLKSFTTAELGKMLVVDANGFVKDMMAGKAIKYCEVEKYIYRGED